MVARLERWLINFYFSVANVSLVSAASVSQILWLVERQNLPWTDNLNYILSIWKVLGQVLLTALYIGSMYIFEDWGSESF